MRLASLTLAFTALCFAAGCEGAWASETEGSGAAEPPAEEVSLPPVNPDAFHRTMRTLQFLQDSMVEGNQDAGPVRTRLLSIAAEGAIREGSIPAGDAKEIRALITFVLSGGDPQIGKDLLKQQSLDELHSQALDGAIAYAEGDKGLAAEKLLPLALGEFPASLAAHLSLVKSALRKPEDSLIAIADLRTAQALAPGTLVEESALRRAMALAAELGEIETFEASASRYFRRFPRSIFKEKFLTGFPDHVASLHYGTKPDRLPKLRDLLLLLPPRESNKVWLAAASDAVRYGYADIVRTAAEQVGKNPTGASEADAAQLYLAAVQILGTESDYEAGLASLKGAVSADLVEPDKALASDALRLSGAIRIAARPLHGPPPPPTVSTDGGSELATALTNAMAAIAAASEAIKTGG